MIHGGERRDASPEIRRGYPLRTTIPKHCRLFHRGGADPHPPIPYSIPMKRPTRQRPRIERSRTSVNITARPSRVSPALDHSNRPVIVRSARQPMQVTNFQPDPYVDYSRSLTHEGGILITFKNIDTSLRHTLRRLFLWAGATGGEASYLFHYPFIHVWTWALCLAAVAWLNWLIVRRPVEIYSRIEIRPDGMVLDGRDIFWTRYMERGWPTFRPDDKGNLLLSGIYGTRHVDYLTVTRTDPRDPFDRTADVLAAHLQDAMQQLWTPHR